ncbi:TPA: hypothetical protein PTV74_003226 [Clostridium botulinum]|nr:hypothetical protein [Clostridium botulinum]HDK7206381.1 hypothetical protein [Clostridium botulinum]HDK7210117.1 hypothetical protein [Clostridium botulinum]HDK7265566.1 hypothetical protein [Clostridium botulinum]HDK7269414.1 hypothetical protein [Clostridium botulinum]
MSFKEDSIFKLEKILNSLEQIEKSNVYYNEKFKDMKKIHINKFKIPMINGFIEIFKDETTFTTREDFSEVIKFLCDNFKKARYWFSPYDIARMLCINNYDIEKTFYNNAMTRYDGDEKDILGFKINIEIDCNVQEYKDIKQEKTKLLTEYIERLINKSYTEYNKKQLIFHEDIEKIYNDYKHVFIDEIKYINYYLSDYEIEQILQIEKYDRNNIDVQQLFECMKECHVHLIISNIEKEECIINETNDTYEVQNLKIMKNFLSKKYKDVRKEINLSYETFKEDENDNKWLDAFK